MNYTPARYHLVETILANINGEWTASELDRLVAAKVSVPSGAVRDSLMSMMADKLMEAVPLKPALTFRLRTDETKPLDHHGRAARQLRELLNGWQKQHRP